MFGRRKQPGIIIPVVKAEDSQPLGSQSFHWPEYHRCPLCGHTYEGPGTEAMQQYIEWSTSVTIQRENDWIDW